jgi:hypothetical protein
MISLSTPFSFDTFSTTNALQIGRTSETGFGNFEGTIDEVRLWNVARSASQIGVVDAGPATTRRSGASCGGRCEMTGGAQGVNTTEEG